MKNALKTIVLCLSIVLFVGCKTNEQKANSLINDYMYKHLHDYSSYEPVETKVDTAYNNAILNAEILCLAKEGIEHKNIADKAQIEVNYARRKMDIWSDSYSSYGRSEYREAAQELKKHGKTFATEMLAYLNNITEIGDIMKDMDSNEVIGWSITHSFRCKNRGGNTMLGEYLFVVDKDFKQINNVITDVEELDECSNVILLALHPDEIEELKTQLNGILARQ